MNTENKWSEGARDVWTKHIAKARGIPSAIGLKKVPGKKGVWVTSEEEATLEDIGCYNAGCLRACCAGVGTDQVELRRLKPDDPAYDASGGAFGVFATKDLEKGSLRLQYVGKMKLLAEFQYDVAADGAANELNHMYTTDPRCALNLDLTLDASDLASRGMAAYVNDARTDIAAWDDWSKQERKPSVIFVDAVVDGELYVFVLNTRDVKKDEQLLVDYGSDFWSNFRNNLKSVAVAKKEKQETSQRIAILEAEIKKLKIEKKAMHRVVVVVNSDLKKAEEKISALENPEMFVCAGCGEQEWRDDAKVCDCEGCNTMLCGDCDMPDKCFNGDGCGKEFCSSECANYGSGDWETGISHCGECESDYSGCEGETWSFYTDFYCAGCEQACSETDLPYGGPKTSEKRSCKGCGKDFCDDCCWVLNTAGFCGDDCFRANN